MGKRTHTAATTLAPLRASKRNTGKKAPEPLVVSKSNAQKKAPAPTRASDATPEKIVELFNMTMFKTVAEFQVLRQLNKYVFMMPNCEEQRVEIRAMLAGLVANGTIVRDTEREEDLPEIAPIYKLVAPAPEPEFDCDADPATKAQVLKELLAPYEPVRDPYARKILFNNSFGLVEEFTDRVISGDYHSIFCFGRSEDVYECLAAAQHATKRLEKHGCEATAKIYYVPLIVAHRINKLTSDGRDSEYGYDDNMYANLESLYPLNQGYVLVVART